MGVAERRARERDAKRQAILAATAEIILQDGYERLTIRRVAERTELSSGTIYLYFRDKSELMMAFCTETFERLYESLRELEGVELGALEAFEECGRRYVSFARENPAAYVITFCLPAHDLHVCPEEHERYSLRCYELLRRLIERGQKDGIFRRTELEVTAQTVWFALHGLASMLVRTPADNGMRWASQEALIAAHLEMIRRGLQ